LIRTSEFLAAFRDYKEALQLRAFKPKTSADTLENAPKKWTTTLFDLTDNQALQQELRAKNQHCGIYFVVNAGGDTDAEIKRFTAWYVENDSRSIEEQHEALNDGPLMPSIRVETRQSVHAYWLIAGECRAAEWRDVQARLIACFNGDPKIKNPARVMRVPGFDHLHLNGNGLERQKVKVHTFETKRRYTVAQMCEAFPSPSSKNVSQSQQSGDFEYHEDRHAELCQRIMSRGTRNSKGNWDAKCLAHDGNGKTGLAYFPPTGAVKCNNEPACDYFSILGVEGLPDEHLPSRDPARRKGSSPEAIKTDNDDHTPGGEWEPPATFYEHSRPPFPVSELPDSIRPFVEGLARETQTPADLPAILTLTIAAGVVAGKVRVQARPGWTEPTNVYAVVVLPPGNRKSAVFQSVSEPLEEIERDLVAGSRDEIARAASEYKMLEERKVRLEKEASRADNPEDRKAKAAEAVAVAQQLAAATVPVAPRLIVSDATSEVLSTLLAEHGGRITMLSTEGGPFETMAGRYSNGIPNIDVFLKGHSGDTLRIDRRGRSEFVQQPALTIGLTVQPDVIAGLAKNPGFRGRGLLARFFYCLPQSIVGCRQIDPQSLSDQHRKQYRRAIKLLAEIEPGADRQGDPAPRLLYLTAEANALLKEFEHDLEPRLADDGELGPLADWAGKLSGAVVRLAAVLWLIERAESVAQLWSEKIDATAMRRAIAIGQYLTQHARVAFAEMGADANVENAKRVLRWIEKTSTREFTRRDAHQAHRSRFKTVDEIDPALDLLESHSYIRPLIEAGDNRRPGRKASQSYAVNPYFLEASQSGLSITQQEFQGAITYEEGVVYA
jgi:hypothetical protein